MIVESRFNPWPIALAMAVFRHFGEFFDASEEQFARVHKEPSASALAMAVNLSVAQRALAQLDARRHLFQPCVSHAIVHGKKPPASLPTAQFPENFAARRGLSAFTFLLPSRGRLYF
jgi:hypothetical protein